ncbi:class I SAM-dependent methyltransferase [Fusibacter tunisiensis]|uniref:SAM-dependent methyltransferase n=1 Tax=Fusibacter tunisiensis TaxID=1008308 RepID=A0ABS2MPD7_9FIRM|nr:hypothetical protein [Fusibacter tunisiensis]MBM7561264.1 SAM-dependent methyltransferase [Fusibacter tunisiensis]
MTINEIKTINPTAFQSVDQIVIWRDSHVKMVMPDGKTQSIDYVNQRLDIMPESIDKVVIHCTRGFLWAPEAVIYEARRILRRNGRIFLTFYHDEEIGLISKWISKIRSKNQWKMDHVVNIINASDLLIDKNIIIENDLMYFEVIKMENEKLERYIFSS